MDGKESVTTKKVILVGIEDFTTAKGKGECLESLDELSQLAKTLGYKTVGSITQDKQRISSKYLISKGKVDEIHQLVKTTGARMIIFDDDITPSQCRNLENQLECSVVDRCAVILKIFEEHARTKEAKVQVALARLIYNFSKLTGKWGHLSRQKGGIGLREVGEKQLEIDRRIVKNKITRLKGKLQSIDKERAIQRKKRSRLFTAALVGYTNAGKSTIMNALCDSQLLVEDKLFATLDSTVRTLGCSKNAIKHKILISDTVGFINKLPHQLVASFKSTLDEIQYASLLVKVVDVSVPSFERQMEIITETLHNIGGDKRRSFWVFNKIDLLNKEVVCNLGKRFHDDVFISAEKSIGIDAVREKIEACFTERLVTSSIFIEYENAGVIADIYSLAYVESEEYREDGIFLTFKISKDALGSIEKSLNT